MGERLNEGFSFSAYCAFASGATQALFGMRGRSYIVHCAIIVLLVPYSSLGAIVHSAIIVILVPDSSPGAQQSRINCRVPATVVAK